MVYSTEQLDRISELAALLTPISDMAVLLDVDADTLRLDLLDSNSPVSRRSNWRMWAVRWRCR